MAATQSLRIDLTHGFYMSPGFVTLRVDGKTDDGREEREVRFQKLCDVLRAPEPGKKISDKFRIALVQAILFSLKHTKSNDATEGDIYISEDKSTVNVPRPQGAVSSSLKRLACTFRYILSKNMISEDAQSIADDFCEVATKGNFTDASNALNHPIFWTAAQKIRYFKKSLNTEKQKRTSYCTAELMIGDDWINKLLINDAEEVENLRNSLRNKGGSLSIEDGTVKDLADDNTWYDYRGDSWKDFLAFFRNIHAHFWQQKENVLCCFHNDEHDGYWEYFSKRFPGLFIKVYKEYKHPINFHNGVEPKFLPEVYVQSVPTSKVNARANLNGKWRRRLPSGRRYRSGV